MFQAVAITGEATARKLLKAVEEFHTYIERNRTCIPNYAERSQWSKRGAHLLLQTRVKVLNQALGTVFQQWYPDRE